ncbi:MAG TPA: hypothetical protein DDZ80_08045 [Cyanobacteria bacterium UBA8803]|nr:hypothetical protein [Cyanobacteria bacterium UBA9273]HBL58455.1 hypothetical protein [Cyanobacteria bacterium UBA8803]
MDICPCCSHPLLRQTRNHNLYWFCRHCWQEMPNFSDTQIAYYQYRQSLENLVNLSASSLAKV